MLASFGPWPLRDGEVALGVQTRGGLPPEKGEVILGPLARDGLPLAPHDEWVLDQPQTSFVTARSMSSWR